MKNLVGQHDWGLDLMASTGLGKLWPPGTCDPRA